MSVLNAFRLEDQIAIVTGAGAGIGRAIAELLGHAGSKVVVSDLNRKPPRELLEVFMRLAVQPSPLLVMSPQLRSECIWWKRLLLNTI